MAGAVGLMTAGIRWLIIVGVTALTMWVTIHGANGATAATTANLTTTFFSARRALSRSRSLLRCPAVVARSGVDAQVRSGTADVGRRLPTLTPVGDARTELAAPPAPELVGSSRGGNFACNAAAM